MQQNSGGSHDFGSVRVFIGHASYIFSFGSLAFKHPRVLAQVNDSFNQGKLFYFCKFLYMTWGGKCCMMNVCQRIQSKVFCGIYLVGSLL